MELWTPIALEEPDLERAEHVIVLDTWLPDGDRFASKVTYRAGIPSRSDDFAAARDDIQARVARLVRLLEPPSQ